MNREELERLIRDAFDAGANYAMWDEGYALPEKPPDIDEYVSQVLDQKDQPS